MRISAIVIDWCDGGHGQGGAADSHLLTPIGAGTILCHLRQQLGRVSGVPLTVVPRIDRDEEYRRAIEAAGQNISMVARDNLCDLLDSYDSSDWLLILDSRCVSLDGFDLDELGRDLEGRRLARHLVHLPQSTMGTRERVVFDRNHRVRSIQRLYEGVTYVESADVSCSVIPVAVARELDDPDSFRLAPLRARLAAAGVPSQDVPGSGAAFDLTKEDGLLALNELLTERLTSGAPPAPFEEIARGVWQAPGCTVDPTSRVYGPVIMHAGVTLEPRAVVVGPCVLGPGAHVEENATVSQSLLGRNARALRESSLVHRVLMADASHAGPSVDAGSLSRPPLLAARTRPNGQGNGGGSNGAHPEDSGVSEVLKRGFDLVAACLSLVVLSPLLLVAAVLVKLTSRGPAFYSDEREGRHGEVFNCWKFRTMVDRANAQQQFLNEQNTVDGPQFKVPNDPRITFLGKLLRAVNVDELPQLWNVACGDMSLIGPRPSPFRENQICVPWRTARLSVRPGITGLWQICRHERAMGDFHQWIHFDMLYVRHRSFWLDIRILAATVLTLGGHWSVPVSWMIPASRCAMPRALRESMTQESASGVSPDAEMSSLRNLLTSWTSPRPSGAAALSVGAGDESRAEDLNDPDLIRENG